MNQAKLRLSLAVALALASSPLLALGLGQIEVKSKLSQPLLAEIPIVSSSPGEVESMSVTLASPDAFARVGLERPNFLAANLEFSVGRNARGESVIRVTTSDKVNDPYLSFLIEADWGSGKLVREFSVLLDPPYLAPAPRAQVRTATVAPVSVGASPTTVAPLPSSAASTAAPAVSANAAVPGPASTAQVAGDRFGPVVSGQTLSQIASSLRPADVGLNQMMVALLRANPDAFIDDNVNQLKRGAILRIPGATEAIALSAAEAAAIVREQTESWQQAREPQLQPLESAATPVATNTNKPTAADARLRIVPPAGDAASATQSGINAGGSGSELRAELSRSREELAVRDAEIKDLRGRVGELEKLSGSSAELLKLKDSELAALQQRLKDLQAEQAAQAAKAAQAERDEKAAAVAATAATAAAAAKIDNAAPADADKPTPTPAETTPTALPAALPDKPATAEKPVITPEVAPVPAQPEPETPSLLSQPLVLGGGALLVVGLLSWLMLGRGRGKDKPKPKAGGKRGSDAGALAASIEALRAAPDDADATADADQDDSVYDRLRELRATVAARPDQLETHLALLRYHYAHGEADAFEDAATDMLPHVADPNGPQWKEACALGRALCPDSSLFDPHVSMIASDDAPVQYAADDADLTHADHAADTDEFAQALAELDPGNQPHVAVDSVWQDAPTEPAPAHQDDDTSIGYEESAGDDAIATKLDLAQAYLDIGDGEAARALLDEVLAEGSDQQRLRAQRLLSDIG